MIRKSEAFKQMAPLLGISENEARFWTRHLREGGYIEESLPGHGISRVTEDELINFVVGYTCCRHAKHAPKHLERVMTMTREQKIKAADAEKRPLPPFLGQHEFIGAFRALIWDVYEGRFSEWGRTEDNSGRVTLGGGLQVEFGLDARYVEVSGDRYAYNGDGQLKRVAHFSVMYGYNYEPSVPPKTYRRDDDDLSADADLKHVKRFGGLTLHSMGEILINA